MKTDREILTWFWWMKSNCREDGTHRCRYISPFGVTIAAIARNIFCAPDRRVFWWGRIDADTTCSLVRLHHTANGTYGSEDAPKLWPLLIGLESVVRDLYRGFVGTSPYFQVWPGSASMPRFYLARRQKWSRRSGGRVQVLIQAVDELFRRYVVGSLFKSVRAVKRTMRRHRSMPIS